MIEKEKEPSKAKHQRNKFCLLKVGIASQQNKDQFLVAYTNPSAYAISNLFWVDKGKGHDQPPQQFSSLILHTISKEPNCDDAWSIDVIIII